MNKQNTKRALLLSCLSLLLCVSMLVGTTFAWFTDTASTGVNTIVAGNLDIALYAGIQTVEDGEVTAVTYDKEVDESTKLFNDEALWEPGHTEVAYLKVENKGTLALKYQMTINVINEIVGTSVLGNDIRLSEYLKYDIVEISESDFYATRADAIAAIANEQNLATEVITGSMKSGETLYLALIVYMPTTVGNEANHVTGTTAPSIQLGIGLLATQYTYEPDSFDDQYDKDATYSVTSAEELQDAMDKAEDGDWIVLGQDVVASSLTQSGDKEITIDLAGNKLTIGDANNPADGLILDNGTTVNLVNSGSKTTVEYLGNSTRYDAIYVSGEDTILNIGGNIDIIVAPTANSAIHADTGATVNIGEGTNVIVDGNTEDQFAAIYIDGAVVNMTGGNITLNMDLTNASGWSNDAVGVMLLGDGGTFNMTGGTITVNSQGAMAQAVQISTYNGAGSSIINIDGGTFDIRDTGNGTSYAFAIFDPSEGTVVVKNATFTGKYTDVVSTYYSGTPDITITGGTYAFDPSAYVPTGSTATGNGDGTWTVTQQFAVEGDTITVKDPASLTDAIANAAEGSTIILPESDTAYTKDVFTSLMNSSASNFDFNGSTVEYMNSITIDASEITNMDSDGIRYGYLTGNTVFEGCTFTAGKSAYAFHIDDVNGGTATLTFKDCAFAGFSTIGSAVTSVTFENCTFTSGAGWNQLNSYQDMTFINCTFESGFNMDDESSATQTWTFVNCTGLVDSMLNGSGSYTTYIVE